MSYPEEMFFKGISDWLAGSARWQLGPEISHAGWPWIGPSGFLL